MVYPSSKNTLGLQQTSGRGLHSKLGLWNEAPSPGLVLLPGLGQKLYNSADSVLVGEAVFPRPEAWPGRGKPGRGGPSSDRVGALVGGGWQDQVGGLMPGIKVGRSRAQLPLKVEVEEVSVPEGFVQKLNDHLLLVYTGKTRPARNLLQVSPSPRREEADCSAGLGSSSASSRLLPSLQDVLRSWYARLPAVVQNARRLVQQSEKCAEAFHQGEVLTPWSSGPQSECLLRLVGLKPGGSAGLGTALGMRPLGTEAYSLSSAGSNA